MLNKILIRLQNDFYVKKPFVTMVIIKRSDWEFTFTILSQNHAYKYLPKINQGRGNEEYKKLSKYQQNTC